MEEIIEKTKNMDYSEKREYISSTIPSQFNNDQMICDVLMNMDLITKKNNAFEKKQYYNQAIIQCPACKKDISSEAEVCIHCGYPLKKMLIKEGYRKESNPSHPRPSQSTNQLRCPKCGSTSITTEERGYSLWIGWYGANEKKNLCQSCGYKWKPGK